MRTGARALAVAVAVAALPVAAATAGSPNDRVTGGGQVLVGSQGPGDTIAFTAQGGSEAKGQVQVVSRSGGTKFHGIVDCLTVDGNRAEIAGHKSDAPDDVFTVYVMDNGEGAAAGNDLVFLNDNPQSPCAFEDDDDQGNTALARGNAQVYDAP